MVSERVKYNAYSGSFAQLYFWRTHDQKEIDLIEEQDGILKTFELSGILRLKVNNLKYLRKATQTQFMK